MRFKNLQLQEELERNGIVKIPFLNAAQIEEMSSYIYDDTPVISVAQEFGFMGGVVINDIALKKEMDVRLRKMLNPICESYLENFKALVYTVLAKAPVDHSKLEVHQDWSVVDERKFCSLSLWIPLIDSTIENGTVHAIKGSHNTYTNIRGGSIPSIFEESMVNQLMPQMEPIEVKAGEALLFNQRLVHYSPKNNSGQTRVSLISSLVPEEADVLLYYQKDEHTTEVYKMDSDFFINYENFMVEKDLKPPGVKIDEFQSSKN
jgi:ectoine hydroxylase-related dioxygenase (phytanoyl-CoA dioxygenase family)